MDLRAVAVVSLSRDDLQYCDGDPSRSRLMDLGDEHIGVSLVGEDIGQTKVGQFSFMRMYGGNWTCKLKLLIRVGP